MKHFNNMTPNERKHHYWRGFRSAAILMIIISGITYIAISNISKVHVGNADWIGDFKPIDEECMVGLDTTNKTFTFQSKAYSSRADLTENETDVLNEVFLKMKQI